MSYHVAGWVLEHARVERSTDLLVLLVLAFHADHDGTNAWPSVETIARKARLSERSVQRALRRLEQSRVIARTSAATADRPATYRIRGVTQRHPTQSSGATDDHPNLGW